MQQIYLAWHDRGSNPRCTALKRRTLAIIPMRFKLHYQWFCTPLQKYYAAGTLRINNRCMTLTFRRKNVFAWNINWIIHDWLSVKAVYQILMGYLPLGIDSQAIQVNLKNSVLAWHHMIFLLLNSESINCMVGALYRIGHIFFCLAYSVWFVKMELLKWVVFLKL
jgi:hypothetical protein